VTIGGVEYAVEAIRGMGASFARLCVWRRDVIEPGRERYRRK
jgi:hypothetical protein